MRLTIVIVNWNTRADLLACLNSIYSHPPKGSFEIRVVDNASRDGSAEAVAAQFPQVHLIRSTDNLGFGRANNLAVVDLQSDYLLLLNPDTLIQADALNQLLDYSAAHPKVGALGPKLINADGSLQTSAYPEPTLLREWWRLFHLDRFYPLGHYASNLFLSAQPQPVEALMGACVLLRRAVVDQIGLFDERYFMYSEEIDLCVRIRKAGWQIHWLPEAVVMHLVGQSTGQLADQMFLELYRNKVKFFRKWHGRLGVALYKNILWQAAWLRYGFAQIFQGGPGSVHEQRRHKAAQYKLLLANLGSF